MILYRKPYIESSVFIEYIKEEDKSKCDIIDSIVDAAQSGAFKIHTSAWTIAEVHKRKNYSKTALTEKQSADILPYFREDFIQMIEVDRPVAERAHELCREFAENDKDKSLRPGDAIHIAAAERAGCDVIFSYDSGFLKLKYTKIPIGIPEGIPMLPGTGMESGKLDFGEPEKV